MDTIKFYEQWFSNRVHSRPSISKRILFKEVLRRVMHFKRYNPLKNLRILDVGCGAGHFISQLSALEDVHIKGIDITHDVLEGLRNRYPSVDFEQCNFSEKQPLKSEFDIITAIEVIEHVPYEKQAVFIENCWKSLKDNGMLVMTTPNKDRAHRIPINFQNTQPIEDWLGIQELHDILQNRFQKVIMETCIWYFPNRYMDALFKRLFYPFHMTLEQRILQRSKLGGNIIASSFDKKKECM
jgi:SAM-dependent methyltransferase